LNQQNAKFKDKMITSIGTILITSWGQGSNAILRYGMIRVSYVEFKAVIVLPTITVITLTVITLVMHLSVR